MYIFVYHIHVCIYVYIYVYTHISMYCLPKYSGGITRKNAKINIRIYWSIICK